MLFLFLGDAWKIFDHVVNLVSSLLFELETYRFSYDVPKVEVRRVDVMSFHAGFQMVCHSPRIWQVCRRNSDFAQHIQTCRVAVATSEVAPVGRMTSSFLGLESGPEEVSRSDVSG